MRRFLDRLLAIIRVACRLGMPSLEAFSEWAHQFSIRSETYGQAVRIYQECVQSNLTHGTPSFDWAEPEVREVAYNVLRHLRNPANMQPISDNIRSIEEAIEPFIRKQKDEERRRALEEIDKS